MKDINKTFTKKNIITAFCLIAFAIVSRMFIHGQNWETLTATTVIAGALLGPYLGLAVGLGSVIGTDVLIGNSFIMFYTWSAWAIIGLGSAFWQKKLLRFSFVKKVGLLTGTGIISTLFFYLWTNFGVWQMGWYTYTFNGLMQCYVSAIPFLRNQLLGNLFIVPVVSTISLFSYSYVPSLLQNLYKQWLKLKKPLPKIR